MFGGIVFPLNVWTIRRISRGRRPPSGPHPRVSVVIPARNEERGVEASVRSHLVQGYCDFEVIVVDDRSTDRTRAILAALRAEAPRLRILDGVEPPAGWLGKPHALAQGAAAATGEILLFADADVRYDPGALEEAVALFERNRLDFLALLPGFEARGFWENVLLPYVPMSYFLGLGFLANSDRHRWIAAGGGAGNMIRRDVYDAIGGHAAIRDSVIDDIRLAMTVKRAGFRCQTAQADDRIRVRMYRGFREIFDGFTKNVSYVFEGWFGFVFLVATALTIVAALAPLAALGGAIVGWPVTRGDLALAATALGLTVFLRGLLALYLRAPLWTAWTQALMASVWAAIIARSLYRRFVRREVHWRGRRYDAARARF